MQRRQSAKGEWIPSPGQWPVGPQNDVPVSEDRIWIDGCFDFSHHGHAGAMLQARQLGTELLVGVHSDEAIMENKGPTVMTLKERIAAVEACRWATLAIPSAPYVTSLPWITHYGCHYVVHGDDITSDAAGEDCYRFVKQAGRFKVVKRTPGISTTDLVGRMLLCTKSHFIQSLQNMLAGEEGPGSAEERKTTGEAMGQRIRDYATDESGLMPGSDVWYWHASRPVKERRTTQTSISAVADGSGRRRSLGHTHHRSHSHSHAVKEEKGTFSQLVKGKGARRGQAVIYVDGSFDLFSSGHIEFLRLVTQAEDESGKERGWYTDEAKAARIAEAGEDYGPVFIVAGIHDDEVINHWKGINYPIMNIFERGLCVLQCKYIHAIIFGAPFSLSRAFLNSLPYNTSSIPPTVAEEPITAVDSLSLSETVPTLDPTTATPNLTVYHGTTTFMPLTYDPYAVPKSLGVYREIANHSYQNVNAGEIVERILRGREMYEARQRAKGEKAVGEEAVRRREREERDHAEREKRRKEIEGQWGL